MMYNLEMADRLKNYGLTTVKIFNILGDLRKHMTKEGCTKRTVNLDSFTFFCNKCNKVIMQFCPMCGSTKIINTRFSLNCSKCGAVLDTRFM